MCAEIVAVAWPILRCGACEYRITGRKQIPLRDSRIHDLVVCQLFGRDYKERWWECGGDFNPLLDANGGRGGPRQMPPMPYPQNFSVSSESNLIYIRDKSRVVIPRPLSREQEEKWIEGWVALDKDIPPHRPIFLQSSHGAGVESRGGFLPIACSIDVASQMFRSAKDYQFCEIDPKLFLWDGTWTILVPQNPFGEVSPSADLPVQSYASQDYVYSIRSDGMRDARLAYEPIEKIEGNFSKSKPTAKSVTATKHDHDEEPCRHACLGVEIYPVAYRNAPPSEPSPYAALRADYNESATRESVSADAWNAWEDALEFEFQKDWEKEYEGAEKVRESVLKESKGNDEWRAALRRTLECLLPCEPSSTATIEHGLVRRGGGKTVDLEESKEIGETAERLERRPEAESESSQLAYESESEVYDDADSSGNFDDGDSDTGLPSGFTGFNYSDEGARETGISGEEKEVVPIPTRKEITERYRTTYNAGGKKRAEDISVHKDDAAEFVRVTENISHETLAALNDKTEGAQKTAASRRRKEVSKTPFVCNDPECGIENHDRVRKLINTWSEKEESQIKREGGYYAVFKVVGQAPQMIYLCPPTATGDEASDAFEVVHESRVKEALRKRDRQSKREIIARWDRAYDDAEILLFTPD